MEVDIRICCCANCGISFALPLAFALRRERDHQSFYCPSGHSNYYPQKSEAEILRERLLEKDRELNELKTAKQKRSKPSPQDKPKSKKKPAK